MNTFLIACSVILCFHGSQPSKQTFDKIAERERFHQPVYGMPFSQRYAGYEKRLQMENLSPLKNVLFRNVGPEIQGGRVVDIAVPEGSPASFLVAFATGGLWKTDNMGTTWTPLFEKESSFGIGAIAVSGPNAETIWVGTGEANSSRTSYSGTGMFKSTDGGQTWKHVGLEESHHIGRVLVDPKNPNVVYVAALGHLYSWNEERGVYKTTNGGKSWERILYVNERTGAIDIVMDPRNSNILYAAMWERDRRAWNFLESGVGSGVYKTINAGRTWTKLEGGLPNGQYMGRVGLSICRNQPQTLYAVVDNQALRPNPDSEDDGTPSGVITMKRLSAMTDEQLQQVDRRLLDRFLRDRFGDHLPVDKFLDQLRKGEVTKNDLLKHLGDANSEMFDQRIIGKEVYRSNDGGKSWNKTNLYPLYELAYTYGYYFGQIVVAPNDPNKVYLLGVPLLISEDGGVTWSSLMAKGVHVDHHALWIDPRYPNRVALGNDGGINLSWDGGKTWQKINNLPVGQFTTIAIDQERPFRILGGLQDNGTMRGPSNYSIGRNDPWDWETIGGGDGATVVVDPRDSNNIIVSSQFGSAFRRDPTRRQTIPFRLFVDLSQNPLRNNWVTPIVMSSHHPDIIYFGSNRLFRSMDQGVSWVPISPDLTENAIQGDVPFGTLTSISESPKRFGLIYCGTDEGKVWRTMDGGATWTEITGELPRTKWVSRIIASGYDEGTVYLAKSGYREDDFKAYLWKSNDYGNTWTSIADDLPSETVNVIKEDPVNSELLYVGTDMGVFASFDKGRNWHAMSGGLPNTPVHDLVVHPRDSALIIATHGRSVFLADVQYIQKLTKEIREKPLHLFPITPITRSRNWGYGRQVPWESTPRQEPGFTAVVWLRESTQLVIELRDLQNNLVKKLEFPEGSGGLQIDVGLNFLPFNFLIEPAKPLPKDLPPWEPKTLAEILADPYVEYRAKYVPSGEYTVIVRAGAHEATTRLTLRSQEN